jgi:hypothetical protein
VPDSLELHGFDELIAALERSPEIARPIAERAMDDSLRAIVGVLRPYPPQPDRMRSGRLNTYERGTGFFPTAAFEEGERKRRGAYEEGPRGGRVRRVSELLGNRWAYEVQPVDGGVVGILGNLASYSEAVQGVQRAHYHEMTGWVNVDEALTETEPLILSRFEQAADELIEELANV